MINNSNEFLTFSQQINWIFNKIIIRPSDNENKYWFVSIKHNFRIGKNNFELLMLLMIIWLIKLCRKKWHTTINICKHIFWNSSKRLKQHPNMKTRELMIQNNEGCKGLWYLVTWFGTNQAASGTDRCQVTIHTLSHMSCIGWLHFFIETLHQQVTNT